jgi:serine/threonine-protein kinase
VTDSSASAQVAAGLDFMHSEAAIHRDLKPANILCGRDGVYKLGDFGLSRMNQNSLHALSATATYTANIGSPAYMAPELLAQDGRETRYSTSIDIYSFGVIVQALWAEVRFRSLYL